MVCLHETLLALGAAIEFVEPEPNLPDLVFTANAAIVLDGKALLARFRYPQRQGEEPIFGAALRALKGAGGDRYDRGGAGRRVA
jgi:N-dimethylarginine dimethylaminohydrolase